MTEIEPRKRDIEADVVAVTRQFYIDFEEKIREVPAGMIEYFALHDIYSMWLATAERNQAALALQQLGDSSDHAAKVLFEKAHVEAEGRRDRFENRMATFASEEENERYKRVRKVYKVMTAAVDIQAQTELMIRAKLIRQKKGQISDALITAQASLHVSNRIAGMRDRYHKSIRLDGK